MAYRKENFKAGGGQFGDCDRGGHTLFSRSCVPSDYGLQYIPGRNVRDRSACAGRPLFAANIYILKEPKKKPIEIEKITDLDKAKSILKSYGNSRFFGNFSRTASGQLDRILKCRNRLSGILEQKFAEGTMSWDKFNSVALAAESSAIRNVVAMANRMQLFDEAEYAKLQHYREDDIPDDIQEEQIRLYQKNFDAVKSTIALNEKILLKLDALSMELATSEAGSNEELNSDLLGEIEKLIDETKYYQ